MLRWINKIPLVIIILGILTLGLAPFSPEPHLVEKLRMLLAGVLIKPVDIFDLCLHATFPVLFIIKIISIIFYRHDNDTESK